MCLLGTTRGPALIFALVFLAPVMGISFHSPVLFSGGVGAVGQSELVQLDGWLGDEEKGASAMELGSAFGLESLRLELKWIYLGREK